jgi:hypothetical protein
MNNFEEVAGGKKRKKSGSDKRNRRGMIGFRVTETERQEIEAAAERAGLTVGSYVRARVLSAPKTRAVKKPPIERALLSQLLGQLGRVGGNIHQIVKHLNFGEIVFHREISEAITEFREASAAIMEAMGRKAS